MHYLFSCQCDEIFVKWHRELNPGLKVFHFKIQDLCHKSVNLFTMNMAIEFIHIFKCSIMMLLFSFLVMASCYKIL